MPVIPSYGAYTRAERELLDEVRSQFDAARDMVFSMVQRSGIIMALSSIIMFESFDVLKEISPWWCVSFWASLASIGFGILVMFLGRSHMMGTDHRKSVRLFNRREYGWMSNKMLNDKIEALQEILDLQKWMSFLLVCQIVSTAVSVFAVGCMVCSCRGKLWELY